MTDSSKAQEFRSSALKRLKDTYKPSSGILLPRIERHVMKTLGDSPHSVDWMHPSAMSHKDWCGRHDYYQIIGTPPEKSSSRNPSFRMENVFAEGHSIHGKYQTWLWEMGVLVGDWMCRECGHRWFAQSPSVCQFCKSDRIGYKEYPLRRKSLRMEGHADGGVITPDYRSLIEIKSIGIRTLAFEAPRLYQRYLNGEKPEDIWFAINRPFPSHMRQVQLYLWMAWPVFEQAVFIYESKFHQQTKEFVVSYNKDLIAPVLDVAREVTASLKTGTPPGRPLWAESPESKVCTSCTYRRTCWGQRGNTETTGDPASSKGVRVQRTTPAKRKRRLGAGS
jgi:CRISPR/Cas system-associated exonuclease Cas4 (RecB family)